MNPKIDTVGKADLTLTAHAMGDRGGLELGFRQSWITANDPDGGVEAELLTGAGLGTPYMILSIHREGKPTVMEAVDMSDHLGAWINAAIARAEAREMAEDAETVGSEA